jgi:hypothetical protein
MRRLSILSLVGVLSLVGLVAEPASAKGATTTTFTVEQPTVMLVDPGTITHTGDIRGSVYTGDIVSSDGRVVGQITSVVNVSWTRLGVFNLEAHMWGTFRIENAQGSWEGSWQGSRGPGELGIHIIDGVGRGAGAFEGLRIKFHMEDWVGMGEILDPGHQ